MLVLSFCPLKLLERLVESLLTIIPVSKQNTRIKYSLHLGLADILLKNLMSKIPHPSQTRLRKHTTFEINANISLFQNRLCRTKAFYALPSTNNR